MRYLYRTRSIPVIEIYEDFFTIDGKEFYFEKIDKVLFLKGKPSAWYSILIFLLVIITFSFMQDETSGVNDFKVCQRRHDGAIEHTYILKVNDVHKEMDYIIKVINKRTASHKPE